MPRQPTRVTESTVADQVLDAPESSVLDLLDSLLNKGVMVNGDITLGVAGIDLIYLRLSALCVRPIASCRRDRSARRRKTRRRRPGAAEAEP